MADITAKLKGGTSAGSRAALMGRVIAERLTGEPAESYSNAAMQWGTANEPSARAAYQYNRLIEVEQVGFIMHPTIAFAGCSPDGLVGTRGLVEIKCPMSHTHIETLLAQAIPGKYRLQMLWQMACCERAWCDFVSYDPRLPERMRLFVKRLHWDVDAIHALETEVREFLQEVDHRIRALQGLYPKREAAE